MHSPIKNVLQHKINKKPKANFSQFLLHLAWKQRGPILILDFIDLSLTQLLRH